MKMNLVVGLVILFVLGALLGFMGDKWMMCHRMHHGFRPGMHGGCPGQGPGMKPENFMRMMLKDRLNLNDKQFKKSETIIKDTHSKLESLKDSFHEQEKKLIDESFELIKKDLSPEQQKKLEDFQKEMRERKGPPPPCGERMGPPPYDNGPEFKGKERGDSADEPETNVNSGSPQGEK